MSWWEAILFGVIEGITEFLPVSSTGHLTIAERLLGYPVNNADITAFTAIIQSGAVLATVWYFRHDLWRIGGAWFRGVVSAPARAAADYRFGWAVILGSIPIAIIGLLFKVQIETSLRSLWFVGWALIGWSVVMWAADRWTKHTRPESEVGWRDTLIIGVAQCIALVPGVSRSGATMTAGLWRGFDRVTVTKLSFYLSIPALLAAGVLQTISEFDAVASGIGWGPTLLATAVSFVTAYASVAWLLKYVAKHDYSLFIGYRVVLGCIVLVLVSTGTIPAQ